MHRVSWRHGPPRRVRLFADVDHERQAALVGQARAGRSAGNDVGVRRARQGQLHADRFEGPGHEPDLREADRSGPMRDAHAPSRQPASRLGQGLRAGLDQERGGPRAVSSSRGTRVVGWVIVALSAAGCAGKLAPEECPPDCPLNTTVTGTTTGTGSTTTGGGGGPGMVDMCVVNTSALKACQNLGCHIGDPSILSAVLDLRLRSVTPEAKLFLYQPHPATPVVT